MATTDRNATHAFFDKSATCQRRVFKYTGPASYATGGDSLTPEELALSKIDVVLNKIIGNGTSIRIGWYDFTAKKILWFVPNTGVEVAAATDLSGFTGRMEVIGR